MRRTRALQGRGRGGHDRADYPSGALPTMRPTSGAPAPPPSGRCFHPRPDTTPPTRPGSRSTSSRSTRPRRSATRSRACCGPTRSIVADSHSTDGTRRDRRAARRARRADRLPRLRRAAQPRARGCRGDWIFSLDCRRALHARGARRDPGDRRGQRCARRLPRAAPQLFMGRWIRHSGWYPNTASRSCSGAARWRTRSSRCTRATGC